MHSHTQAIATIAVRNAESVKDFYQRKLGLELVDERQGVATYRTGETQVFVYESVFAGTNRATSVTFTTDDVEAVVRELKTQGVAFEHYDDMPGVEREGDIHVGGEMKVAWFKDPDGNILSVVGEG